MTYARTLAVAFAKRQIGKAYQYAAAGPDAFDCSGLVLCSVLAGGGPVLPHQSGQQATALHAVKNTWRNRQKLQPGDVVFYYGSLANPESITHCALFLRRGLRGRMVIAAVDEQYGVRKHRMNWALKPIGFGYIDHA